MTDTKQPTPPPAENQLEELLSLQGFGNSEHRPVLFNGNYRIPTRSERIRSGFSSSYLMAKSVDEALRYYWER